MDTLLVFLVIITVLLIPILIVSAAASAARHKPSRKCPKCGNRRDNSIATQSIKSGNTMTVKKINICSKCGNEFV